MNQPTDEQIKEFWEWCGWEIRIEEVRDASGWVCHPISSWFNGVETALPDLDLNNLFKYVVPKLQDKGYITELTAYEQSGFNVMVFGLFDEGIDGERKALVEIEDDDPALALFWAIYKVIK